MEPTFYKLTIEKVAHEIVLKEHKIEAVTTLQEEESKRQIQFLLQKWRHNCYPNSVSSPARAVAYMFRYEHKDLDEVAEDEVNYRINEAYQVLKRFPKKQVTMFTSFSEKPTNGMLKFFRSLLVISDSQADVFKEKAVNAMKCIPTSLRKLLKKKEEQLNSVALGEKLSQELNEDVSGNDWFEE